MSDHVRLSSSGGVSHAAEAPSGCHPDRERQRATPTRPAGELVRVAPLPDRRPARGRSDVSDHTCGSPTRNDATLDGAARRAPRAPWPPRALSVGAVGADLDEDVWDRVVSLWRDALADARKLPALRVFEDTAHGLHTAVLHGQAQLLLVADGPLLLGFAALGTGSAGAVVQHVHVRPDVPDAEILTLLVEAAFLAAARRDDAELGPDAAYADLPGAGRDEA